MAKKSPVKKKAKATKADPREALHARLVEQRQELLNMYARDLRTGQESSDDGTEDIVDRANNAYNREFMFSLSDSERQMLLAIEEAIDRFAGDTYGICINCGQEIALGRLQAVPWARYCIDCQEKQEKGLLEEA